MFEIMRQMVPDRLKTVGLFRQATARTIAPRLFGVKRVFLCMHIRSSGESLTFRNTSFTGPEGMENL